MLLNSVLLVAAGAAYNTLTGRRYPHTTSAAPAGESTGGARFSAADLDAALAHYNRVLDVSRDDLEDLLHCAEAAAYQRKLGEPRCRDVMSRDPLTVRHDTPAAAAAPGLVGAIMTRHVRVASEQLHVIELLPLFSEGGHHHLPVVDARQHLVGILTQSDLVRALHRAVRPD